MLTTDIWLPTLMTMDRASLFEKLRRELFQVGDLVLLAITLGKTQQAVNWLALGFFCDQSISREALATSGALRASKYHYRTQHLLKTLFALEAAAADLSLSTNVLRYLDSMKLLAKLAPAVGHMDHTLRRFLKRNADTALKSVVARMDALFMIAHEADPTGSTNDIASYPREELAEGASYIIHCIDEEVGIRDTHFGMTLETKIMRGTFDKMLVKACKIRRHSDAELLVDAFDYHCSLDGRTILVSAPTPELEKSIRLGYVQDEQSRDQGRLMRAKSVEQGAPSVFAIADQFFDRFHERVVQRLDVPISRYTFHLPDVPPIRALFEGDAVTVEEEFYFREIVDTEQVTWEELKRFEYRPGLTLLEFSKVHRLFLFIARLAMRQLSPLLDDDPVLAYRSLVPVFKEKDLKRLLGWCVEEGHIDDVLDFLSWKPGTAGIYDLQYKPILRGDDYYLVPLHITGMTNWYRNLVRSGKCRLIDSLDSDAAERAVAANLREAGCEHVKEGYETVLEGQRIEIDVISRYGNVLFLFECKHPVLPCNVYELRTSYKHMRKGAQQLGRIKDLLSDPAVEKELYRRLGWQVGPSEQIATCIVSGNGMFSGLRVDGHPVRRLPELSNMIRTGVIRTMTASVDSNYDGPTVRTKDLVERNLWNGPTLTPEFLYQYLNEDRLSALLYSGMVEYKQTYSMGERKLSFVSYALDAQAVADAIVRLPTLRLT
ncbi:MAG: hypothetical protein NXH88_16045 [Hyphomonas sp.]|nr:hypothetical protein [Hyphomonas sp.]